MVGVDEEKVQAKYSEQWTKLKGIFLAKHFTGGRALPCLSCNSKEKSHLRGSACGNVDMFGWFLGLIFIPLWIW
jgi:hypothetical protein